MMELQRPKSGVLRIGCRCGKENASREFCLPTVSTHIRELLAEYLGWSMWNLRAGLQCRHGVVFAMSAAAEVTPRQEVADGTAV